MPTFYDPQAVWGHFQWSRSVFPKVALSLEFWICLGAHAALVVLLRIEHIHLPESGEFVPLELIAPLLALVGITTVLLLRDCQRWHDALLDASVHVGHETRGFVQELQSLFGRIDEALPFRFAAAKYSLAAVYVFFFAMTNGTVTNRGWGELRAKGLLDDHEVYFLEGEYTGDRVALLHIWASWAASEAAELPSTKSQLGAEALASGLSRLSEALRRVSTACKQASSTASIPVSYQLFQLHDTLLVVTMLFLAALAAPASASGVYAASGAYFAVLVALFGLRHSAAAMTDPLRCSSGRFRGDLPVASVVNATADAIVQLLLGATPTAFDPRPAWRDVSHTLLSLSQIERRTPAAAFAGGGANPCRWREVKAPLLGVLSPPPLLDVGCCHLDADSLPAPRHCCGLLSAHRATPQLQRVVLGKDGTTTSQLLSDLQKTIPEVTLALGKQKPATFEEKSKWSQVQSSCISTASPASEGTSSPSNGRVPLDLTVAWTTEDGPDTVEWNNEEHSAVMPEEHKKQIIAVSLSQLCCGDGIGNIKAPQRVLKGTKESTVAPMV